MAIDLPAALRAWWHSTKLHDVREVIGLARVRQAQVEHEAAYERGTGMDIHYARHDELDALAWLRAVLGGNVEVCDDCDHYLVGDPSVCIHCHWGPRIQVLPLVRPSYHCPERVEHQNAVAIGKRDAHDCDVCYYQESLQSGNTAQERQNAITWAYNQAFPDRRTNDRRPASPN